MLNLVLGIAGSGKTAYVMNEITARSVAGKNSILLVPEQFSSSAESMAYGVLGDEHSAYLEVLSFRTLAGRIFKTCGGLSRPVLTDAGRVVYVRRALAAVGGHLKAFARQKRSAAFCGLCAHTLAELKTAGATPARLREIAELAEDAKMEELALIYEAYEAELGTAMLDDESRLAFAAAKADCGYLDDKAVYIDSFDGFTAPEYEMISRLLLYAQSVTAALCCPGLSQAGEMPDLFTPVRRAAHRLIRIAQKQGVAAAAPTLLPVPRRHKKQAITDLNLFLAEGALPEATEENGVWVTKAEDEWEELRLVAAKMHALALEGVPYSKMAVICRDMAAYETAARRQMAMFGIPLFCDSAGTVEYTPPVAFLRAALALLRQGLTTRGVLDILKTGLCGFAEEDIAALENYVYTWEPYAAEWRAPFTNNPDGFMAHKTEEGEQQLAAAEGVRAALVPVLEDFMAASKGKTAAGLAKSLYLLMDKLSAPAHAQKRALEMEQAGEVLWAEENRRAWDVAMDLLDEMVRLVGAESLLPREFDDLFLLLVRGTDFANAPQTLECATLTTADRMRLAAPQYCFVVGAAEGEFPMQVGYSGLLNHHDRERLVENGIEMPGSFENRVMLEEMFFYKALSAASDGVYISWPSRRGGVAKSCASALQRVGAALCPPALSANAVQLAATPAAAFDYLAREYRENTPLAASVYKALETAETTADETGIGQNALALLKQVDNPGSFFVRNEDALHALTGRNMRLSPTVVERFYQCRFSYYMERVLKVRPRNRAVVSPLESGTFVHHVLEMVLRQAGEGFAECTDEQLAQMAMHHAEEFIKENLPVNTARAKWQLAQIKESTARLLCFMRDAAAQSDFAIDELELDIGGGEVPPLEVETAGGRRVSISGKIDRVDVLRRDGKTHLCIVDYKTGSKKFSLDDVYYGLNMQMMIYMAALCKNGGKKYNNPVPAGVLYLAGDPAPESGTRAGSRKPIYKMDGLLLNDAELLHQMDRQGDGIFIPVRFNRDGSPRAGKALADGVRFNAVLDHVQALLCQMAEGVSGGSFAARPLESGGTTPCAWCPYRPACRHEDGVNETKAEAPENAWGAENTY